jgi:hypothetical protein
LISLDEDWNQGDQMSLWKITQNVAQPIFCPNLCLNLTAE